MSDVLRVGVLFSAGIDSTTQIALLKHSGYKVYPIIFDDESSMTKLKRDYAVEFWMTYFNLQANLIRIRYMRREEIRQPSGYVPGWKLTMIMNALAYCEARKLEELHVGYLRDDRYPYPDESPEAMQSMVDLYNRIYSTKIKLQLSINTMTKAELITWGAAQELPYEMTFSCRRVLVAGLTHCGKCDICRLRRKAFLEAQIADPTLYVYDPELGTHVMPANTMVNT